MRVFKTTTPAKVTLFLSGAFMAIALSALAQEIDPDLPQIDPPTIDAGTDSQPDAGEQVDSSSTSPIDAGEPKTDSSTPSDDCASIANVPPKDPLNPGAAPEICTEATTDCLKYDPQFALWSDGAVKDRYVFVPKCADKIDSTSDRNRWSFPVGTRFYKNFRDLDETTLLESRVITKVASGNAMSSWRFQTYHWSGATPELVLDNKATPARDTSVDLQKQRLGTVGHRIPPMNACNRCHNRAGFDAVLGFGAVELNGSQAADRKDALSVLIARQQLDAHATDGATISSNATERAALGYLHGNCSNCHSPGGDASLVTDLTFLANVGTEVSQQPVMSYVCKSKPNGATAVTVVDPHSGVQPVQSMDIKSYIAPGHAEQSFIYARMSNRTFSTTSDGLLRAAYLNMPPIASYVTDVDGGQKAVREWINQMSGCETAAAAE